MYGSADRFRYQQRERVRAFARERFFPFYRRMFPTLAPEATFSGALHFRVLARALERVANGETRRLMIAIPPRHGKTLLASVAFPGWILGRDPTCKSSARLTAISCRRVIAPNGSSLSEVRLTSKGSNNTKGRNMSTWLMDTPLFNMLQTAEGQAFT